MQNTSQTHVVSNSNVATPNNAHDTVANTTTPTPIPTHQTPKELRLDGLGIAFCFLFIIGLVFSILPWSKSLIEKRFSLDKKHNYRNLFWVVVCALLFTFLLFALFRFGLFYPEHNEAGVMFSRVDALILIISIIGIIGAIWAILARVDAEKAFNKSQETLDALGTTFGFSEILNNDKLPEIINSIGEPNREVSLFLGFPCVGYLYENKGKFRNKPEILFLDFITKLDYLLNHLDDEKLNTFHLSIAVFSRHNSRTLLTDDTGAYNPIPNSQRDPLERFYERIDSLKRKKNPRIKIKDNLELNENLRFASLVLRNEPSYKSKAMIWIVPDFANKNKKEFESASFQSSDPKIIFVLDSVFESEEPSSNLGEPEATADVGDGEKVATPKVAATFKESADMADNVDDSKGGTPETPANLEETEATPPDNETDTSKK